MHYVYEINIGDKKQIGSTSYIEKRLGTHLRKLIQGTHWNSHMQNAYNKYNDFTYRILSSWNTREEAYNEEQRLLNEFFGKENYMMQSSKALGASPDSNYVRYWKGKKISEETKKKISESQTGKKLSDEQKMKISNTLKGRQKSSETREKMKGSKSDKMKESMSNYAKNRTESHRKNLSNSMKGKKLSEETKKKLSQSQKGISKLENAKKVYQFDLKLNLINTFNSTVEAAKQLKVSPSAIANAARGKSKTSAGYIWKYKINNYE